MARSCLLAEHIINTIADDLHLGEFGNSAGPFKRRCYERLSGHLKKKLGPDSKETQTPSKGEQTLTPSKRKDDEEITPSKKKRKN